MVHRFYLLLLIVPDICYQLWSFPIIIPLLIALLDSLFSADFQLMLPHCHPFIHCSFRHSVSNRPFIVTSCSQVYCVFCDETIICCAILAENKGANKEVGSQTKQHWLVTRA